MKLMHLSDLHLGRRLYEYSLIDDQKYLLNRILALVEQEQPRAVLIAGDVYDKSVPSAEAVALLDEFLCRLSELVSDIFLISGNHDSPERIAFGGRLMDARGVHISPVYSGAIQPITLDGRFDFYLLPFVRPATVRAVHPDAEIETYTDAVKTAVSAMPIQPKRVNILVAHQFVTGATRSDSEETFVGDAGNVDIAAFDPFDYVALGHIHASQNLSPRVRYCGTPMMYSVSERNSVKTATIAEIDESGAVSVRTVPIEPLRRIRQIQGNFSEVTEKAFYASIPTGDYIKIVLTDETDVPDAHAKLRTIYPNLLCIEYDNARTRRNQIIGAAEASSEKSPVQLFEELFEKQNNQPMSDRQRKIVAELIEELKEETV